MPLFEYRCAKCDHLEEVLQKHGDPPPAVCPQCGKKKTLRKEMSKTSFQLKGGGWYKDLYASASAPAASSDATKTDTQSDAKPETKTEKPAAPAKAPEKPAAKPEKKTEKKAKAAA